VRALVRALYRIRVQGLASLPEGGALLVANHLSHVDALLIGAALWPRHVRFLMHRSFFRMPVIGTLAARLGAIPVASEDSAERKAESLRWAADLAASGGKVCIFSEGGISRSGTLLPFARGVETIARDARVPIVPVALDRVWGSIFSFSGRRFFWKRPRRVPYPVDVALGEPMPFDSERWQVRDAVAALVARTREERAPRTRSLAWRFLRRARQNASSEAACEAGGARIGYGRLLREALLLRSVLLRTLAPAERVGVLLPPGQDALLAHAALALCGRACSRSCRAGSSRGGSIRCATAASRRP